MTEDTTNHYVYILNLRERVVHRAIVGGNGNVFTNEQCNVDDIEEHERAEEIPEGYHHCQHCMSEEANG